MATATLAAALAAGPVFAASANPFGLVYQNALAENVPGKVQVHPVSYDRDGIRIAANVYTPAGYSKDGHYAAVVVAHPNGGVKEQVAGEYAQRLAGEGYVTIAADAACQGDQRRRAPAYGRARLAH